ncbi:IS110 family transposase [Treponema medium]|nr:IS110 family transposase [Treponema medium]
MPRVDCSGTINKYGHITKKGNKVVRALLYQAAWAIVRSKHGGVLKAKYFSREREEAIDNSDSTKKEQNCCT